MPAASTERVRLAEKLESLVCEEEAESVCCRTVFEIVGGTIVEHVQDFPHIARIHFKTSYASRSFCGASLIHPQLLLTAKHCIGP